MTQVRFILSDVAHKDIDGICRCIAERNLSAALGILDKIEAACQLLAENPELGEMRSGFGEPGCRSFTVAATLFFSGLSRTVLKLQEFSTRVVICNQVSLARESKRNFYA